MTMRSKRAIEDIIRAVDGKTGHKQLNLKGAVNALCDGYTGTEANAYQSNTAAASGNIQLKSGKALADILDRANAATGYSDGTITEAVQRLCDSYTEPEKLYSVGLLSDLHLQYGENYYYGGAADLERALTYLKDRVEFTCVCGDLVAWAGTGSVKNYETYDYMEQYRLCVEGFAGNMPMYECAGNHETYPESGVSGDVDVNLWKQTTGKEMYYSVNHGNDVYVFLGMKSERRDDLFPDGSLEWFEATLEANKDKRCFVFQHVPKLADSTGDPSHGYSNMLEGASGDEFIRILKKYPNTIWFHGHTHLTLGAELYPASEELGYRSVHIPSLVGPRFYDKVNNKLENYYYNENNVQIWGSTLAEGYIMDVYQNKVVLRGINFAAGAGGTDVAPMGDEIYSVYIEGNVSDIEEDVLPDGYTRVEFAYS